MAFNPIQHTPSSKTALPPIAVRETVRQAWEMSKAEWRPLFKILAVPSLLLAIVGAIAMAPSGNLSNTMMQQGAFMLLYILVGIVIKPWVMVSGLRYIILGEMSEVWWPNYNSRMWRYLWKTWLLAFCVAVPIGVGAGLLFALLPKFIAAAASLMWFLVVLLASTRIYPAITVTAVSDDNSLKTAWRKTRGQILRIGTIGFLAGLKLFLPMLGVGLLVGLLTWLLGSGFSIVGQGIMIWFMMVIGMIVFLPMNALLYAHFYQDKPLPDDSQNQSAFHGGGGPVGS